MTAFTEVTTRCSNTIQKKVSFSGIGIHTGTVVDINFCPAKEKTGIVFKRIDLPGQPLIPASLEYVCDTSRSTSIGLSDVRIHTVEHILAAVKGYNIDNLIIEINSIEPPVANGSSDRFVQMIEEAGVEKQDYQIPIINLKEPVFWSRDDIHIIAIPYEGYKVSYTLNYPDSKVLKSQYYSIDVNQQNFKKEIAPCRTFTQYEELSSLLDRGLIKGGSLDNAVVIKDDVIFSKDGLFFPDEMVRHKILDLIGDLALIGIDFNAHIIAIRSGHKTNFEFAKKLYNNLTTEKS